MSAWSNIEISPQNPEIIEIDKFEKTLGKIPVNVQKIRELISRFEVCHFKYKKHLKQIKESIKILKPYVEPASIGINHISKGKDASKNDTTGRSILGYKYLGSLKNWLGKNSAQNSEYLNNKLDSNIKKWLGNKNPEKERLVCLLIARLTWDWESYEKLQQGGKHKELEFQVCRMDICHYAFPKHLDLLLQGIGRMELIENFQGCGSSNYDIKNYVKEQFLILCKYLKLNADNRHSPKTDKIKLWLTACLAKVLKEQVGLKISMPQPKIL